MSKLVLRDCFISVDGVDLSDHISSVEVSLSKEEVETTNFGGAGKERVHGLKDDAFTLNFQQDFDAASVDATLYPLYDLEDEFVVIVRPTKAVVSATNPQYTGTCILLEYQPLNGDVGSLAETSVTIPTQRTGITRTTA